MNEDCEARDLAEEGLYVGRKPLVLARERYKMEHRLLREPDGKVRTWTVCRGLLVSIGLVINWLNLVFDTQSSARLHAVLL